ncbi:MAG: hypothetical protein ACRD80_06930 [Nitrososphaeraceae archaeon]
MNQIKWTSFIVFTSLLALVIQLLIISPVMAQGPNTTSAENRNNTKLVVNFKNHTISIVDTITNETISVKPFPKETGNMTTNETLSGSIGNMTTNDNLTEKFKELG